MRRLPLLVVAIVVAASCARTVNVEQEKAALMARDAEWATSTTSADTFASFVAPDGTIAVSGAPGIKGPEAIRAAFEPMMKATGFGLTWQATRADVSASGDLGYTAGNYTLKTSTPSGIPVTEQGKYQTVWKKIDGTWKVLEDSVTSDTPPALLSRHVVVPAAAVKWTDAPPSLPPGAKLAVISGDPGTPEPFTLRLQMPNGYRIAPHTHPTDEHVTVLSGTLAAAMGETFDAKALGDLGAGSYAVMSADMPHYVMARGTTVVQVHGIGPFVFNYVNPADDPSKK
jgi:ketosteroid isomerase-like protein/quercetin dioxygenase-like cupin family protein